MIDNKDNDVLISDNIWEAKRLLTEGEVIGIPTETVYGLAANALNPSAVAKIFEIKNRPFFNPLIIHIASLSDMIRYVSDVPPAAVRLFRYMPGPLTLLLSKNDTIPDIVTAGSPKVAIRIPAHPLTLHLLQNLDFPLAAPSANPFGYVSPTTAQHVADQLAGKIPFILDGAESRVGVESTIVGFEGNDIIVYRFGGLGLEEIEEAAGQKVIHHINESSNPLAPGMLKSHYATRKPLLFDAFEDLIPNPNAMAIVFDHYLDILPESRQVRLSADGDLAEAAGKLFSVMRDLDSSDCELIYAIRFPDIGIGRAINDRLKRASV